MNRRIRHCHFFELSMTILPIRTTGNATHTHKACAKIGTIRSKSDSLTASDSIHSRQHKASHLFKHMQASDSQVEESSKEPWRQSWKAGDTGHAISADQQHEAAVVRGIVSGEPHTERKSTFQVVVMATITLLKIGGRAIRSGDSILAHTICTHCIPISYLSRLLVSLLWQMAALG